MPPLIRSCPWHPASFRKGQGTRALAPHILGPLASAATCVSSWTHPFSFSFCLCSSQTGRSPDLILALRQSGLCACKLCVFSAAHRPGRACLVHPRSFPYLPRRKHRVLLNTAALCILPWQGGGRRETFAHLALWLSGPHVLSANEGSASPLP